MRNEDDGKIAETTVAQNNNTSLPSAFRTNEGIEPGDTLVWRHETCETGDRWTVEKKRPAEDSDSNSEDEDDGDEEGN